MTKQSCSELIQWQEASAAYKYLRENPDLVNEGFQVVDLHDLGWPRQVPGHNGDFARRVV